LSFLPISLFRDRRACRHSATEKRNVKVTISPPVGGKRRPWFILIRRYRVELANRRHIYELSPTRIQHNERPASGDRGRLHAKTAVIDQSTVYIGSVISIRDPRARTPEAWTFARVRTWKAVRVINISKLQSLY
jgi:hypothetical protein